MDKSDILSSTSPEQPFSPSTHTPENSTDEKRLENDVEVSNKDTQTNADAKPQSVTDSKEKVTERGCVIKQKNVLAHGENDQRLEDKEDDKNMETEEKEEEHADAFRWGMEELKEKGHA